MEAIVRISSFVCGHAAVLGAIYGVLCLIAFIAYGYDKAQSKKPRSRGGRGRIPEASLLWLAFFGSFGAFLGMHLFRHKTKHLKFRILVALFCILTLALAGMCWYFGA